MLDKMSNVLTNVKFLFFYVLLSYPLFYYAYKFGSPDFGNVDFYQYYHLYKNWDFSSVESPFNMRLISTFFIYLINKIGLFYHTEIGYNNPHIDKQIFFNAILFNYISTVFTCWIIYKIVLKFVGNEFYSFAMGILYLLGFGTLFFAINTLTEAFSFLLFSLIIFFYYVNSLWAIPLVLLSVIQREYIFLIVGALTLLHIIALPEKRKYSIKIFIASIVCAILYILLRKTIFFTPVHAGQMDVSSYFSRIIHPSFPMIDYIKQSFFTQNILFIYIIIIIYKYYKKMSFNKVNLLIVLLVFLQTNIVSFIALLGNSCGRYFYITMPLVIFFIAAELKPLLKNQIVFIK